MREYAHARLEFNWSVFDINAKAPNVKIETSEFLKEIGIEHKIKTKEDVKEFQDKIEKHK